MDPEVSFGAWVTRQRKALDLTRAELAECVGCSVSGLRKIESDERRPSREMAEQLANCLRVPPDQHPTFLKVARGQLRVERLGTPLPASASVGLRPTSPRPASNLPISPTPLVGREVELAELAQLLRDDQCRLLTLTGPGGIGKTRLATEAAAGQREHFSDGVYFVPLASSSSPQFMVPAIADVLGFVFSGQIDPKVQLLNYMGEKSILLVLDNLEHLLEDVGLLAELIQQAPGVKLLVTSRERLNLRGEWLFDVQGLPVPPLNQVDWAEEYSAVELFMQNARRVQAGFVLKEEERLAVSRICHLVEGMPLAIELAAAWVPVLTCQEIAHEIERGMDFLATSMRDVPERQRSLRATFDHSWNLLAADERDVLCRLAVFRGGFERDAAEQVAGATLPSLLALASKSLVRRAENGRYDLHEVVHQYALSHLADDPECELATRGRHCEFYLALLRDREMALKSAAQREALRELTDEIDNVRAGWTWAVKREMFGSIGPALRSFALLFDIGGWVGQGIAQLESVVQILRGKPKDVEWQKVLGQVLTQQGDLLFRQGQFEQAIIRLEESLTILRPIADPVLLTGPLIFSGTIMHLTGRIERAQSLINEGLTYAQAAGDQWFTAYALLNQGYIASLKGRYAEGYEQMLAGLAMWRALGDPRYTALALNFMSPTAIQLGHYEEAGSFLEESLALCTQVGDRWGMGTAYRYMGLLALAQGEVAEARALLHQGLDVFTEVTMGWDIVQSLVYLGQAAAAAGDPSEASRIYLEALQLALEVQVISLALDALTGLAHLQAQTGQAEQALELLLCVLSHPSSTQEAKDRAQHVCAELEPQLTPQQIEAVQARAQVRSFDVLVTELLNECLAERP